MPRQKSRGFCKRVEETFWQTYPEEGISSNVLLQLFLTGLLAPASCQVLLHGKPTTFAQAIKNAMEIEYTRYLEKQS